MLRERCGTLSEAQNVQKVQCSNNHVLPNEAVVLTYQDRPFSSVRTDQALAPTAAARITVAAAAMTADASQTVKSVSQQRVALQAPLTPSQ
jgi:hypothetical protein